MAELPHPHALHLQAARGWLDLGNTAEAVAEMEKISHVYALHPEVLLVRARIEANLNNWQTVLTISRLLCDVAPNEPSSWLFRARALQQLNRASEAYELLMNVKEKFENVGLLFYELARASAKLGRLEEAREWFQVAISLGDGDDLKEKARRDPILRTLWPPST